MAIFQLMINVVNLQPGRPISIAFSDGVAIWTLASASPRAAGLSLSSRPAEQVTLGGMMLSTTTLLFTGGFSPGTLFLEIHVDVPDGTTTASGVTDTDGDTEVYVTYATESGVVATLMGDWTIELG